MADRIYLHIGLPKTATTYLQTIMWGQRDTMRAQGVLLPGAERREHLWVSRTVREDQDHPGVTERQRGAWDRLRTELAAWPGTALISHEFFAAASEAQARRMLEQLAPAEVHLVVTAREPLGLFTSSWQESLKNRDQTPMSHYSRTVSPHTSAVWNWRTLDLGLVLDRWAPVGGPVPPERVHVLPLPGRSFGREEIWRRFARTVGVDPDAFDLTGSFANEAMGVAEAETLRRVNAHLGDFELAIDRGTYIRTFLADERLVTRGGEKYWPDDAQVEETRRRGAAAVALIEERGYDVVGDLADLAVPDVLEERRRPSSVTDTEVAEVAVSLVGVMLGDVRSLRHERRALRDERSALEAQVDRLEDEIETLEDRLTLPLWRLAGSRVKQRLLRRVSRNPS